MLSLKYEENQTRQVWWNYEGRGEDIFKWDNGKNWGRHTKVGFLTTEMRAVQNSMMETKVSK